VRDVKTVPTDCSFCGTLIDTVLHSQSKDPWPPQFHKWPFPGVVSVSRRRWHCCCRGCCRGCSYSADPLRHCCCCCLKFRTISSAAAIPICIGVPGLSFCWSRRKILLPWCWWIEFKLFYRGVLVQVSAAFAATSSLSLLLLAVYFLWLIKVMKEVCRMMKDDLVEYGNC